MLTAWKAISRQSPRIIEVFQSRGRLRVEFLALSRIIMHSRMSFVGLMMEIIIQSLQKIV
ncbi:hypothetical protein VC33_18350 [Pseudomonas fluorescens]|nr:hypothetical protein VC33_18350 [Pseudomonas fluorescens]OOG15063.1 hypothetical protein BMS17_24205 [Pseudomonas sp. C9]